MGEAENTNVETTTNKGAEVLTGPDGGMTLFKATRGTVFDGGFRVPVIIHHPPALRSNGLLPFSKNALKP